MVLFSVFIVFGQEKTNFITQTKQQRKKDALAKNALSFIFLSFFEVIHQAVELDTSIFCVTSLREVSSWEGDEKVNMALIKKVLDTTFVRWHTFFDHCWCILCLFVVNGMIFLFWFGVVFLDLPMNKDNLVVMLLSIWSTCYWRICFDNHLHLNMILTILFQKVTEGSTL